MRTRAAGRGAARSGAARAGQLARRRRSRRRAPARAPSRAGRIGAWSPISAGSIIVALPCRCSISRAMSAGSLLRLDRDDDQILGAEILRSVDACRSSWKRPTRSTSPLKPTADTDSACARPSRADCSAPPPNASSSTKAAKATHAGGDQAEDEARVERACAAALIRAILRRRRIPHRPSGSRASRPRPAAAPANRLRSTSIAIAGEGRARPLGDRRQGGDVAAGQRRPDQSRGGARRYPRCCGRGASGRPPNSVPAAASASASPSSWRAGAVGRPPAPPPPPRRAGAAPAPFARP